MGRVKVIRKITACGVLLFVSLFAGAQIDTISTVNGKILEAKVKSFSPKKGLLRVETPSERVLKIPGTAIASIHFGDGYLQQWTEGTPVRDDIINCPTMRFDINELRAEGIFRLSQSEMRSLYGPLNYGAALVPYRVLFWKGLAESAFGSIGLIEVLGKGYLNEWKTFGAITKGQYYTGWVPTPLYDYGYIIPLSFAWVSAVLSSLTVGLADLGVSLFTLLNLSRERDSFVPISQNLSKFEFIGGLSLAAAGIALSTISLVDMNTHWVWGTTKQSDGSDVTLPPPSKADPWLLLGGFVAIEAGLSFALAGGLRLHCYNKINLTPTPGGIAFSCRF